MTKEELKIIKSMEERISKLEDVVKKMMAVNNKLIKQAGVQDRKERRMHENINSLTSRLDQLGKSRRK